MTHGYITQILLDFSSKKHEVVGFRAKFLLMLKCALLFYVNVKTICP